MKSEEVTNGPEPSNRGTKVRRGVLAGLAFAAVLGVSSAVAGVPPLGGSDAGVLTDSDRAVIRDQLRSELRQTSVKQQRVAADGQIEVQELWELAADASECAVEAGAPPIEVEWTDKGLSRTQNFGTEMSNEEINRLLSASDVCWDEHVGIAEQMASLDLAPSADEQVEFNRQVTTCLADAGVALDSWPGTDADIDPELEAQCVDAAGG